MSYSISPQVVVIGAGIGGLTAGALLAQVGYRVIVLEAQAYAGGCAGTFSHRGYRFDAGATVAGGFQPGGPHELVGRLLDLDWPVRSHDPAWVVHLPDHDIALTRDHADVLAQFPHTRSFWHSQRQLADLGWQMAAAEMPWLPGDLAEVAQLVRVGLNYFPADLQMIPYSFRTVADWLRQMRLDADPIFRRFLDAQLLISAQTTSEHVNALWGATALDLAQQGVYHVAGGLGGLAETLVNRIQALDGEVRFRQQVTGIEVEQGRVTGVQVRRGKRTSRTEHLPADFVIANLTPFSLNDLLGTHSPQRLRPEANQHLPGWGAFVLHIGVREDMLPAGIPDHHQVIASLEGPLGEGESVFVSLSPRWDDSRAPQGFRAGTLTTHTRVQPWWDLLARDPEAYEARKHAYTEIMLKHVERALPGFRGGIDLLLPGSPVTYQFYTGRPQGLVGGFPMTSLFRVRGPRTGLPNLRLVGDSIFPGQSTAGVSLGALRVARDVQRQLPVPAPRMIPMKETMPP